MSTHIVCDSCRVVIYDDNRVLGGEGKFRSHVGGAHVTIAVQSAWRVEANSYDFCETCTAKLARALLSTIPSAAYALDANVRSEP